MPATILVDVNKLEADLKKKLPQLLGERVTQRGKVIERRIKNTIRTKLERSAVIASIRYGELKHQCGLTNSEEKSALLIKTIVDSVKVTTSRVDLGAVMLSLSSMGIQQLTSQSWAMQDNSTGRSSVDSIPWLQWLLEGGTVVTGYHVVTGNRFEQFAISRAGRDIMKEGGSYSIPAQFTNELKQIGQEIEAEVVKILREEIGH